MTIPKSFLKTWNGECSYQAIECFGSISAAAKSVVPSTAAKIVVDEKSIRYQHSTIKEVVNNDDTLQHLETKIQAKEKERKKLNAKITKLLKNEVVSPSIAALSKQSHSTLIEVLQLKDQQYIYNQT